MVKVLALGRAAPTPGPGGVPLPAPQVTLGSGVVVTRDCLVVTSKHVVARAGVVAVRFAHPDQVVPARVAYLAPDHDLAVLAVDREACAPAVGPEVTAPPPRGLTIFKIGYGGDDLADALRLRAPRVARGVLSRSVAAAGAPTLEVYVPIAPGDSGGLICTEDGAMVGVTLAQRRGRTDVGYLVPAALVAAALRQAREGGGLDRARAALADPTFAAERVTVELAAALAEGERPAALLRRARAPGELAQALALRWTGQPEGLRLLAALGAATGALAALEPAPGLRAAGCRLLARARDVFAEVRAAASAAPTAFEEQLATAAAPEQPVGVACGRRDGRAGEPGASQPASAPGPGTARTWRRVTGERAELYARWAPAFLRVASQWHPTAAGLELGGVLPLRARGKLALGIGLGYAFTHVDAPTLGDLHRVEIPLRIDYGTLFGDVGLALGFGTAPAGVTDAFDAGGGLVLRLGIRKVFQAGVDLVVLSDGTHGIFGLGFFAGIGY